jgi:hypothetical protein
VPPRPARCTAASGDRRGPFGGDCGWDCGWGGDWGGGGPWNVAVPGAPTALLPLGVAGGCSLPKPGTKSTGPVTWAPTGSYPCWGAPETVGIGPVAGWAKGACAGWPGSGWPVEGSSAVLPCRWLGGNRIDWVRGSSASDCGWGSGIGGWGWLTRQP